jgi:glycogen operon protein
MTQHDWSEGAKCLGLFLNGEGIAAPGPEGEKVEDDSFLLLFNACPDDCEFTLPSKRFGATWEVVIDTAAPEEQQGSRTLTAGERLTLVHRSLVLARRTAP